jgi:hypothetical protein
MKKKFTERALLGFPIGISIGYVITIIISILIGEGKYYNVTKGLADTMGSEISAVILQTLVCGFMGAAMSLLALVWEMDSWSIAKQSFVYFVGASLVMLPAAYIMNWMEHSLAGFLGYFGIFLSVFVIMWIVQYFVWKDKVGKLNKGIRRD